MTDQIDKSSLEICAADDEIYEDLQTLAEELPEHSPRYILLSCPLTLVCFLFEVVSDRQDSGRTSVPYVLLYYMPSTCNAEMRMLYAGAKEIMRNTSEAGRSLEIGDAEEVIAIEARLKGVA